MRVSAPCRLHFGLKRPFHPFGGLGAMIASPRVEVEAMPSELWSFSGSLAARAERIVRLLQQGNHISPHAVIANGPPEHTGLGVGTALSMSMCRVLGLPLSAAKRGERSQIGVYGFEHGGFLVDHGHGLGVEKLPWSSEWCFALIQANVTERWHDQRERDAFNDVRLREPQPWSRGHPIDHMFESVIHAIRLPFSLSVAVGLSAYNWEAGYCFSTAQGGIYADPNIEAMVTTLKQQRFFAGQSSWGPTVFVFLDSADQAKGLEDLGYKFELSFIDEFGVKEVTSGQ